VALDPAVLHLDAAADSVDHAAELDDRAVAGALDDAAAMGGDRRVDEVAAEPSQARERTILVGAGESATRIAVSLRISPNRASARAEAITKSRRLSAGFSAPGSARSKARIAPAPPGSRHPWAHGRGAWGSRRRHRNA